MRTKQPRTERFEFRLTTRERELLDEIAEVRGIDAADVLRGLINDAHWEECMEPDGPMRPPSPVDPLPPEPAARAKRATKPKRPKR